MIYSNKGGLNPPWDHSVQLMIESNLSGGGYVQVGKTTTLLLYVRTLYIYKEMLCLLGLLSTL